jgi:hypothetical protein
MGRDAVANGVPARAAALAAVSMAAKPICGPGPGAPNRGERGAAAEVTTDAPVGTTEAQPGRRTRLAPPRAQPVLA